MDALLDKYRDRFGEQFPLMLCRGLTDDEICRTIQQCLDNGEPFDPELDSDSNY
jgi:hypothetical protein